MIFGLVASASSMGSSDYEFKSSYKISYTDNDGSDLSRGLIDYLSQENEVEDYAGKEESRVLDLVFFQVTEYHMDIEEGFEESVENDGEIKLTYTTSSESGGMTYAVNKMVNDYIDAYRDYREMGYSEAEATGKAKDLLSEQTHAYVLTSENENIVGGMDNVVYYLHQFFGYLIIGCLSLGIGHVILVSDTKVIRDRVATSPVKKKNISLTNTMGLMTSGVVIWAIFSVVAWAVGHDTSVYKDYWWLYLANSFIAMLVGCSITSLITAFNIQPNTLTMVTNILSLAMSFICGVFVPMSVLSPSLLNVAKFFPLYWMAYADNMTITGTGIIYDADKLILCLGIELLFAVAMSVLAMMIKSSRLSRVGS
jgi:ABC-2 type transport system permease protein